MLHATTDECLADNVLQEYPLGTAHFDYESSWAIDALKARGIFNAAKRSALFNFWVSVRISLRM